MIIWFVTIGILGLGGIIRRPTVLSAIDPRYGLDYLLGHGFTGFVVLGAVFLCATGAEALYADLGHFGARPIRLAWFGLVFPTLLLNYAGQTAVVSAGDVEAGSNPFFVLCPAQLQVPLVALATLATIIASQAIISGAFSMTRQTIQLGWLPRMRITQTSAEGYGQIYVGLVNWAPMLLTVALVIGFGSSDNLASAFGIAVSLTMLLTTFLLFLAMRDVWHWNLALSLAVAGLFAVIDLSFVCANFVKVLQGGWVPLGTASIILAVMMIWHRGINAVAARMEGQLVSVDDFLRSMREAGIPRVPGTAVFLTRTGSGVPPVMLWHVKHNRALHSHLITLVVRTESIPWVGEGARLTTEQIGDNFWRLSARYGFMNVLTFRASSNWHTLAAVTYYVGHETVLRLPDGTGLPAWQEAVFGFLERNAAHVSDFFNLPRDRVVEIGRQVEI